MEEDDSRAPRRGSDDDSARTGRTRTEAATASMTGEEDSDQPLKKRQRGVARGNERLYQEFRKLKEHYQSKAGKTYTSFFCMCLHCKAAENA